MLSELCDGSDGDRANITAKRRNCWQIRRRRVGTYDRRRGRRGSGGRRGRSDHAGPIVSFDGTRQRNVGSHGTCIGFKERHKSYTLESMTFNVGISKLSVPNFSTAINNMREKRDVPGDVISQTGSLRISSCVCEAAFNAASFF